MAHTETQRGRYCDSAVKLNEAANNHGSGRRPGSAARAAQQRRAERRAPLQERRTSDPRRPGIFTGLSKEEPEILNFSK
ncbi:hypothetical protein MHYP_G00171240 [Metynnis hypsauchen]